MGRAHSASAEARARSAALEVEGRARLRIVRPRDGDRLLIDPARPPTLELLATHGGVFAGAVQWQLDGAEVPGGDLVARAGEHVLTATRQGETVTARFTVETR